MILTIVFLVIGLLLSIWLNVSMLKKTLVLSEQREALVDQIEDSLDMLDECHSRLSHHAEIPVLSDEPIIRELIYDIKRAKNAVLAIAGKVVIYGQEKDASPGDD